MKLETIKGNNKKRIIIGGMIVLSVLGCLTLTTTRAKYRSMQSVKLATGTVNINSYDFKIIAMKQSEDGENYTDINTMPESGYIINEEKSYCTIDNKTQVKGKLKTINGIHGMYGLNKNDKCYIWFDKINGQTSDSIITAIETSPSFKTGTPTFTSAATGAETEANNGIYKVSDGMYGGYSYYWRGATTTNHVIFDSKCWRIVRINGDKTMRLIYNGVPVENTCPSFGSSNSIILSGTAYNSTYNNSSYVGWTYTVGSQRPNTAVPQTSGIASPIMTTLENWYNSNISSTAKTRIATGKFCNDRNIGSGTYSATGTSFYYAAYVRLLNGTKSPTLSCPNGDIYHLSVGLISADEVQFAGASGGTNNTSYYLCNDQYYWTMTPYQWYYYSAYDQDASMFYVDAYGYLSKIKLSATYLGVRPVINLRSDITFNAGSDGTSSNPYIVE